MQVRLQYRRPFGFQENGERKKKKENAKIQLKAEHCCEVVNISHACFNFQA